MPVTCGNSPMNSSDLGVVVHDKDKKQYWRPADRA